MSALASGSAAVLPGAKTTARIWRLARPAGVQAPLMARCCAFPQASYPSPPAAAAACTLTLLRRSKVGGHAPWRANEAPRGGRAAVVTPAALPSALAALAASPYRDCYVAGVGALGAVVLVKIFNTLAASGAMDQKLSRKLVHTIMGPLFVLTWTLFSSAPSARWLAAAVPAINLSRLLAVGIGLVSDPGLVASVSRSGDRAELLKGPLYYVATLIAATLLAWRDNPAGLIAVAMMCGGDGLADIVGRRWGRGAKLPHNPSKSWAGSGAMLAGGFAMAYGLISLFCWAGFFACYPLASLLPCLGAVALAATVVESLPLNAVLDDNLSVPAVAAGLALLLLPQPDLLAAAAVAGVDPLLAAVGGAQVGLAV